MANDDLEANKALVRRFIDEIFLKQSFDSGTSC